MECELNVDTVSGGIQPMSGNTNINDTSEHILEITLWVMNGYTTVLEISLMSNVPESTNMCG